MTRPRRASPYLPLIAAHGTVVAEAPAPDGENPLAGSGAALAWPVVGDPDLRDGLRLAQQVDAASELLVTLEPSGLTVDERAEVAGWDSSCNGWPPRLSTRRFR